MKKSNDSFDKAETNWTCSISFDFVERTKFHEKTYLTLLPKQATLLPFLATKSNVASTLLLVLTGLPLTDITCLSSAVRYFGCRVCLHILVCHHLVYCFTPLHQITGCFWHAQRNVYGSSRRPRFLATRRYAIAVYTIVPSSRVCVSVCPSVTSRISVCERNNFKNTGGFSCDFLHISRVCIPEKCWLNFGRLGLEFAQLLLDRR